MHRQVKKVNQYCREKGERTKEGKGRNKARKQRKNVIKRERKTE